MRHLLDSLKSLKENKEVELNIVKTEVEATVSAAVKKLEDKKSEFNHVYGELLHLQEEATTHIKALVTSRKELEVRYDQYDQHDDNPIKEEIATNHTNTVIQIKETSALLEEIQIQIKDIAALFSKRDLS